MSTETTRTLVARIIAFASGAGAATAFVLVAYAAGYDSIAKGAIQGAGAMLAVLVLLWAFGRRSGLAGRVAGGIADERDGRILTHAFADAAIVMAVAAVGAMIGSFYGLPGAGVAGIVLWAGLLTVLASAVLRARRW